MIHRDLTGLTFGNLTVLQFLHKETRSVKRQGVITQNIFVHFYMCKCTCGNKVIKSEKYLRYSKAPCSCGCLAKKVRRASNIRTKTTHGYRHTGLYRVWQSMVGRCKYPKTHGYKNYGGRGITVCNEWLDFATFKYWALSSGYKEGLSIERIDVNGNYTASNCKWITRKEQALNRRANHMLSYKGETHCISEWARRLNIPRHILSGRIRLGWEVERIFTEPIHLEKSRGK